MMILNNVLMWSKTLSKNVDIIALSSLLIALNLNGLGPGSPRRFGIKVLITLCHMWAAGAVF